MTRIIAGSARGRRLDVPAAGTRPTSDRVREALFSRLESIDAIRSARVLDLFAGTGALGLEALSRGARSADLVDRAASAVRVCRRNVRATGLPARVHQAGAAAYLAGGGEWDLVLIDPPYDFPDADLDALLADLAGHLSEDAVVVVERSARSPAPGAPAWAPGWVGRTYGETTVWLADAAATKD